MMFPIRFYCALGVSAAPLAFLPRFEGQNLRSEVAIMKFPIRFYCALCVSAAPLAFLPCFVSF